MSTKGIHVCPYPVRNVAASCLREFMSGIVKSFMSDHTDRLRIPGQEAMFRTEKREKNNIYLGFIFTTYRIMFSTIVQLCSWWHSRVFIYFFKRNPSKLMTTTYMASSLPNLPVCHMIYTCFCSSNMSDYYP